MINEAAAVIRRLIEGLSGSQGHAVPVIVAKAFDNDKKAIETARGRLMNRITKPKAYIPIGVNVILITLPECVSTPCPAAAPFTWYDVLDI
jgi:hypothetical protein